MTDEQLKAAAAEAAGADAIPWYRQKFVVLIMGATLLALSLTGVSLYLYSTSIAAQLDLSQPGYESVRADVEDSNIQSFNPSGVITSETIDQFEQLYDEQIAKTKSNQFSSKALTNKAIGISKIPD